MAEVIFKAPWCGPKCTYFGATEAGETVHIPDEWLSEIDPKITIVISATSVLPPAPPAPNPGTLLREADWLRGATQEEQTEIMKLRQPDPEVAQPVLRRRPNVIPGAHS